MGGAGRLHARVYGRADNAIVLALLDGEFTIKRYRRNGNLVWLQPENPDFHAVQITEPMEFEVWGVIRHSIRLF